MARNMFIQGRKLMSQEIGLIRDLMAQHGDPGRTRNDRQRSIQSPVKDTYYDEAPDAAVREKRAAPRRRKRQ